MSRDERDNKVLTILKTASEPLGPTEIARRINESWCVPNGYPLSSVITPVCRRIRAVAANAKYSLGPDTGIPTAASSAQLEL